MDYSARMRLEDELAQLSHQHNQAMDLVSFLPTELTRYNDLNLEDLSAMAQAGNQATGEFFTQVQYNQMDLQSQCSMELEELDNNYYTQKRSIENRLDAR